MDTRTLYKLKTLLIQNQLKIAVAESLSCGHLQAALGSLSGSSAFFEGGITAYSLQQKIRLLNVDPQHAKAVNCVSQTVADEMAMGICRLFQTDIGLATTGYAEPAPENIAAPLAFFAICQCRNGQIMKIAGGQIDGSKLNRIDMQKRVSNTVINRLLTAMEFGEIRRRRY